MIDLIALDVDTIDFFRFMIPASAVGSSHKVMVQVCVEYGDSIDSPEKIAASVWAAIYGQQIRGFIMDILVPKTRDPQDEIITALNQSDEFAETLNRFVDHFYSPAK